MSRPPAYDEAYPRELWKHERAHLRARVPERELPEDRPSDAVVGVALSGGGIRSATFCLGVFQALAQLGHLAGIDYISTVSGGGYFGSFLGRLYQRREIENPEHVRSLLDPTASSARRPAAIPDVVAWLRENGRYLSPNGAGDVLINAAILLRNWVTIQVVLISFVLLVLMSGQLLRLALELGSPAISLGGAGVLWWSPWIFLPGLTLGWWAAPLAWAYWLTGRWKHRRIGAWPVWGVALTAGVASGLAMYGPSAWAGGGVLLAIVLTLIAWGVARRRARGDLPDFPSLESQRVFEIDRQRNLLSIRLKVALATTGALLAFALVDSVGQTLYLLGMRSPGNPFRYLYSVLTALAGAVAFAQRIAVALAGRANGGRLPLPAAALVTAGALAITTLLLVSLSVLAHGLAWRFNEPSGAPALTWATPAPSRATVNVQIPQSAGGPITATTVLAVPGESTTPKSCGLPESGPCGRGRDGFLVPGLIWVILLLFALAFGKCWPFINQSSLYSMYSARLTRAYMGASNPRRRGVGKERITEVAPGDNIDPVDYWPPPQPERDPKARPLHVINVTINETVDGRSNVQQQDRKGTGLALGPCSFSVGIRHHAVFPSHQVFRAAGPTAPRPAPGVTVFPPRPIGTAAPVYQVFTGAIADQPWRGGEPLSVGQWTGISGAAFSTGLGARTNLGLSLLCGLTNVRLGYWWDCGVEPEWRPGRVRRPSFIERQFPVQAYLLSELLSRFYGTSRRHWYLSDGGHFENMGAYELIRRRLGRIVLIDAEADPHYTFDGLANLVRKARLDFGAEIEFLSERALDGAVPNSHRRLFGSLEQLRRGKWTQEPVKERQTDQPRLTVEEPVDEARHSLAHAALARVTFADDRGWEGWLLYVKPTLIGDEPSDVAQYHRAHPPFPQETTADQFFDEAQWESYRMLGYHIGLDVFGTEGPAPTGPTTVPPSPSARIFGNS